MDPNSSTELEVKQTMDDDDASCADLSSLPCGKRKAKTLPSEDSDEDDNDSEEERGKEVSEERNSESDDQRWGYDSFEGVNYQSPEDPPEDEDKAQFRRYMRHYHESKGFKVDKELTPRNPRGIHDLDLEAYFVKPNLSGRDYMTLMVNVVIDKYNQMENKTLTLESIKRVSVRLRIGVKAYITFMAKESPQGELVEYQAKAERKAWQRTIHPIFCRPAPKSYD